MTITQAFKKLASKMLSKPIDQVKGDTISEVIDYTAENYGENSGGLSSVTRFGDGQIVENGKLYVINVMIGTNASASNGNETCVINQFAYKRNTNLTKIMIPREIKQINGSAFELCSSLTDVYYEGSEVEWNAVGIGNSNDPLWNATKHFNWDRNTPIPVD